MSVSTKPMVHRLPITKARINLGSVVRRIHMNKDYVILEKDGIPIAGMMDIDELEDYLELQDPALKKQIAQGYEEYRQGKLRDAREFLKELRNEPASVKRKKKSA